MSSQSNFVLYKKLKNVLFGVLCCLELKHEEKKVEEKTNCGIQDVGVA